MCSHLSIIFGKQQLTMDDVDDLHVIYIWAQALCQWWFLIQLRGAPKNNASTSTSANELSFICFSLGEDIVVLGQLRIQSLIFLEPSSLSLSLFSIFLSAPKMNNVKPNLRQRAFVQWWCTNYH
jgi:hypothetical protein